MVPSEDTCRAFKNVGSSDQAGTVSTHCLVNVTVPLGTAM